MRLKNASGENGSCTCHSLRSEEHTSELQSQSKLVCRLLLEKKDISINPPDKLRRLGPALLAATTTHKRFQRRHLVLALPSSQRLAESDLAQTRPDCCRTVPR